MIFPIQFILYFVLKVFILHQVFGAAILQGKSRGHAGIFVFVFIELHIFLVIFKQKKAEAVSIGINLRYLPKKIFTTILKPKFDKDFLLLLYGFYCFLFFLTIIENTKNFGFMNYLNSARIRCSQAGLGWSPRILSLFQGMLILSSEVRLVNV
jgi:hypothetical protein